ncbi:hypothetical protein LP416_09965 [Polaromonas sp. P2-4]|nr:hypothetical protein LP416_09965 [Polaromonas sp. P2-4]
MVDVSALRTCRSYSPASMARGALTAVRDDCAVTELCKEFQLHLNQITEWKRQLLEWGAAL